MKQHKLRTLPCYFKDILSGIKTFEIRRNDRDFQVGDTLILQEYEPNDKKYTDKEVVRTITYITQYGQKEDFVVMAII